MQTVQDSGIEKNIIANCDCLVECSENRNLNNDVGFHSILFRRSPEL
jgi:hypothetical protein